MASVAPQRAPLSVRTEGPAIVLTLCEQLDDLTGPVLVDAVASAVATAPQRVEIDLTELLGWTDAGAQSLVRCRELCRDLPDGLHYRTGRGPGRDALLAAYR